MGEDLFDACEDCRIGLLRVHVTQKSEHDDSRLDNDVRLGVLDEGAVLDQISVSVIDVGCKVLQLNHRFWALSAQGHVDCLDAEVAGHGDCSVDVVAKALEKLGSLRLDHVGLLLVARVECEANEFDWLVHHLLSLGLCRLDEVEAYVEDQVRQKPEKHFLEAVIQGCEAEVLECLNYKVADGFLVEQLLEIGPLPENNERLDHHRDQVS